MSWLAYPRQWGILDILALGKQAIGVKKKVPARKTLQDFGKRGASSGDGVKAPGKRRLPDFRKDTSADGYGAEIGDGLLRRILADEAVS